MSIRCFKILVGIHTIHPDAVKPSRIALEAKKTVARCFGFLYTASKYTFSPPLLGNMVPNSSQTNRPQKDMTSPRSHSISDAPTEPTDPRIEEGVEKIPVPMVLPTLSGMRFKEWEVSGYESYMRRVQVETPRWRPIPPAASTRYVRKGLERMIMHARTFFER